MTEQAANRMLNATEQPGPIQDGMSRLPRRWIAAGVGVVRPAAEMPEARELVRHLVPFRRTCLKDAADPVQADGNIMVQDFQTHTVTHDGRGGRD